MKFTEILTEYNIETLDDGNATDKGWIQLDCPQCGRDTHKFHLGYNVNGGYFNCWRCGFLPLANTLSELTHLPISKCLNLIKHLEKDTFDRIEYKGKLILPKGIVELMPQHKKYLRKRGFDPYALKRIWNVQAIGIAAELSWRLFIPITFQGQVVSWTTRTISDNEELTRYISASKKQEAIPHKELLYGEEYLRHAAIINEGPTDAWNIGPGAVCTFGVTFSIAQILKLSKYPVRAVCFDNSSMAQKRAKKLCDELSVFPGETYNVVLKGKDPGSASRKEIEKLRKAIL